MNLKRKLTVCRGGFKIIFTLARLASESNFTLASEDFHSPGGENMQNENHLNVSSLIWFACRPCCFPEKKASAEGASLKFLLISLNLKI